MYSLKYKEHEFELSHEWFWDSHKEQLRKRKCGYSHRKHKKHKVRDDKGHTHKKHKKHKNH